MAALDFPSSPTLNQIYSANGKSWIWDGVVWNAYSGVGGNSITTSATAPLNPSNGDLWFNTENGLVYVYYVDANSQQWVAPDNSGGFNGGTIIYTTQVSTVDTQVLTAETWTDIAGLSITRSPISTLNKIRLRAVIQCGANSTANGIALRFVRGATPVGVGVAVGNRTATGSGLILVPNNDSMASGVIEFDDEPATTSSTIWKVQFIMLTAATGTAYINRSHNDANLDYGVRSRSVFTLEEILP